MVLQTHCLKCQKCGQVFSDRPANDCELLDKIKFYTVWRLGMWKWTCDCGTENVSKYFMRIKK